MDPKRRQESMVRPLDRYIQEAKNDVIKNFKPDFKMNITKQGNKAMKDLLEDNSINIRPRDKGSGIVVLDTDKYRDEIELLEVSTYKQINENTVKKTENQIKKIVEGMYKRQSITKEIKVIFHRKTQDLVVFKVIPRFTKQTIR